MVAPASLVVEDQSEVVDFLSDGANYDEPGAPVTRIDTHGAMLFLVGERAFKLKRAVRYPYMDFSTAERRHAMCDAELDLNRRTAPDIYRRVLPVTREADGRLALKGSGSPVDWLVEMVRFDQATLFDRMAAAGGLDTPLMAELAEVIAGFHERAERRPDGGGADALGAVIDTNARQFETVGAGILDAGPVARLTALSRDELERQRSSIEGRRRDGFVRRCHGDLHLRNIFLYEGRPTLFDALEFNEALATHDILYDLAFLLMDLWHRDLGRLANVVMNHYLWRQPEMAGLALLPLFLSSRAAVRAHVSASIAAWSEDSARVKALHVEARAYLALALDLLSPAAPRLIALGGLSGTGKSTLAMALAHRFGRPPGAAVLRSDVLRKEIMGVPFGERLGDEDYAPAVTAEVYDLLRRRAEDALAAGQAVVVDAVHARPEERQVIEAVAKSRSVRFDALWLEAPPQALEERVSGRRGDVSDATVEVVRRQLAYELGEISWPRLDASAAAAQVCEAAAELLESERQSVCGSDRMVPR